MPKDGTATRERILETAERLVIENGYSATSLDQVIAASGSSKGAFFHHFGSKLELAQSLVSRYVAADVAHLEAAVAEVAGIDDPAERVVAFLRVFEDGADGLMGAQSSCLYVAVLTERQLAASGTSDQITGAIVAWRETLSRMLAEALAVRPRADDAGVAHDEVDTDALADHVFVTFEGAFLLCRSTGDAGHMRAQLRVLRQLVQGLLGLPVS